MGLAIEFGSGVLFLTPNAGNLPTHPTPQQLGILQEVQVDFKGELKKLFGQKQLPVAAARGKLDVTIKGKFAALSPTAFGQLYFGVDTATGMNRPVYLESHAPAASVAPTHTTTVIDLGVINGDTGQAMTKVASSPTIGQYSFTAATAGPTPAAYVFNAGETATKVLLNYQWPDTAGTTLVLNNQLMGFAPQSTALLYNNFRNNTYCVQLNSIIFGSLSVPTKLDDFWISDFDATAFTDATDTLGSIFSDSF